MRAVKGLRVRQEGLKADLRAEVESAPLPISVWKVGTVSVAKNAPA